MIADLTPAEIDAQLSKLWDRQQQLTGWLLAIKSREARYRTRCDTRMLAADAASAETYRLQLAEVRAEAAPYEAEFVRRGGWLRYFLVKNDNGHVHRGLDCSTCYPTTLYGWIVELADCDEAAMVEEFGEKACTVCFPDAPALQAFHGPGRRDREAQAARKAEKDAKAVEKAAKAITAPDGSPLRVGHDTIATKIGAQRKLSEVVQSFGWYGRDEYRAEAAQLFEALEAAGIDPQPIIARANAKVAKEGGHHRLALV